jgi:hypothetical protein
MDRKYAVAATDRGLDAGAPGDVAIVSRRWAVAYRMQA